MNYLGLLFLFPFLTTAHVLMSSPPSLGYAKNQYVTSPDYDLNFPIKGAQFPCKEYHKDFARGAGRSVATWPAGSMQSFRTEGAAVHGGGSCQVSLSYDGGGTFRVIKSWIGTSPNPHPAFPVPRSCPAENTPFNFAIPPSAPSGAALFAWTWFNKIGNREMYMNCAVVTITGGGSGFASMVDNPRIFVAQIGTNACTVKEGVPVDFPNPGAVVVRGERGSPPNGTGCV
ncbi:hypothetical protein P167DRAFT_583844 [Morchella conica CCBAS932]|uniref:Lytic polysaccharide monooxygenase n=1 Tax=Morchella conica CCBAS932 TaxID=1392247 RepID=A0A3N4KUL4_9PEZI|nr:hypothetical protein P167DRAFT_583844 [Morchella conica CCBAS932]